MSDAFEGVAGPGVMTNMGVIPKGRFQAAMSDIFKGIPQAILTIISRGYGTGDHDRHDPGGFVNVKFKQVPYVLEAARICYSLQPHVCEAANIHRSSLTTSTTSSCVQQRARRSRQWAR